MTKAMGKAFDLDPDAQQGGDACQSARTRERLDRPGAPPVVEFRRDRVAAVGLYDRAWSMYGARCLWNLRRAAAPDADDAEAVALALRANGNLEACMLADQLRTAYRA